MTVEEHDKFLNTKISRRKSLRMGLIAAGSIAAMPLLAACGDDDDDDEPGGGDATDPTATTASDAGGDETPEDAGEEPDADETEDSDVEESPADEGDIDRSAVGGRIVFGRSGDSDSLDPHHTIASISWQVFSNIYDPLVVRNMDLQLEPLVAESWEVADDGLTYTFKIREGIKFHDGTPLNAEAVAFTFNRVRDPEIASPSRSTVVAVDDVVAIDEYTVEFRMKEVFSPLLGSLTSEYLGIISPTAVEKYGEDFGQNPVGSGPFKFKEWVPGERITLERNDEYINHRPYNTNKGAPYLEELVFRNIPEEQTQIAALETGEINLMQMPAQQMQRFENDDNYELHIPEQSSSIMYIEFSIIEEDGKLEFMAPFDDLRVRQAVAHAVDADTIIERVLQGLAVRNYGLMPSGNFGYTDEIEEHGYHYDPDRSRELLEEAGWVEGSDGIREKDGQKLEVVFWTWNATTQERIAQVIQAQLAEVGIDAKLETMEVATVLARLSENQSHLDLMSWGNRESDILYRMTDTESQLGLYQKYSPAFKEQVDASRLTTVPEEQAEHYFEAMKIALEDCVAVPLWSAVTVYATRSEVIDFHLGPQGYVTYLDAYQEL